MFTLLVTLILTGIEIAIYLPPQVFTADFCYDSDNYIIHNLPVSNEIQPYVTYYINCYQNITNPFKQYLDQANTALSGASNAVNELFNYSSTYVPSTVPQVNTLQNDVKEGYTGVDNLFSMSNCTTVTPLYSDFKQHLCYDLLDAVYLLYLFKVILAILSGIAVIVALVAGCIVAGQYKKGYKRLQAINERGVEDYSESGHSFVVYKKEY